MSTEPDTATTGTAPPRVGPLRGDPAFRRFLIARAISWAGSTVTLVALPLLIYQRTRSPALTAALTALEAVPYLSFGLLAGVAADRVDRRRLMVAASWTQAAVLATIPAADVLGILTVAQLLAAATISATAAVFFDAASFAVVPALVGRDRIAPATSAAVATYTTIGLAGPAAGGALAASLGPATAISLDVASFAVAALLLGRLPAARLREPEPARPKPRRSVRADVADGLRFIWRHPLVRPLTLLGIGNSLTGGAVLGLVVVVAVQRLGLTDHDWRIGLLYVAAALGTLAATAALPRLSRRVPVGRLTLAGLAANWLALLAWAGVTSLGPALVALLVWQATNSLVSINGIVVRGQVTPGHLQGRVNTTARMIAWGGQPLGATIAGALAAAHGVRTALLVAGAGVLVAALAGWATPLRRRRGHHLDSVTPGSSPA
jgi:MFS family permease